MISKLSSTTFVKLDKSHFDFVHSQTILRFGGNFSKLLILLEAWARQGAILLCSGPTPSVQNNTNTNVMQKFQIYIMCFFVCFRHVLSILFHNNSCRLVKLWLTTVNGPYGAPYNTQF